jgi:Xaa-Pro dipeptidase
MVDRGPPFFQRPRLSALLDRHGAELLLVCSRQNVGYLADYTYYVGQGEPTILEDGREWSRAFVGIPRDDRLPAFMTAQIAEEPLIEHADPWISDRRSWGPRWRYSGGAGVERAGADAPDEVVGALVGAIRDRGLQAATIAIELTALPADTYLRVRDALPGATFVDASAVIWALRLVKTDAELDRLRTVASITDAALVAGYEALDAACREEDMRRVLAREMAARGASFGWCSIAFGPKGARNIEPTERLPQPGEIVRVDLVGTYRGYYSDMSRVGAFQRPPIPEAAHAHETILHANAVLRREAGPGVLCSSLYRLASDVIAAAGFHTLALEAGHGIGRDVGEPPYLSDWDETVLEPGMVVCLEPAIRVIGVGSVNIEDMVVITPDGCEPLTRFPRELIVWGNA